MADRVDIVFGAEFDALVAGVAQVRDQLQSLAAPVLSLGDQFTLAGAQMGAAPRQASDDWTTAMSGIERGFDGALKGVLSGTETWRQAMSRLFVDLEVSFADMVMRMMVSWAASGLGLGGAAGGAAGSVLGGGIMNLASGLFGGTAAGDVGGIASLAAFDAGAWSVPQDMIAPVHAGEMILPADAAAMARAGAGAAGFAAGGAPAAGGVTLNVSVQAIDAAGVAQWANANARTLAATVSRYVASNPSAGGMQ